MKPRRRNPNARSNRGREIEVFFNNLSAGKSVAEQKEEERINRINYMLSEHKMYRFISAHRIFDEMKLKGIRINNVERDIIIPLKDTEDYKDFRNDPEDYLRRRRNAAILHFFATLFSIAILIGLAYIFLVYILPFGFWLYEQF